MDERNFEQTQGGDSMEIKAKCKFDFDSIRALAHVSAFKKADPKKRFLTWSVISAILTLAMVLEMVIFFDTLLISLLYIVVVLFLLQCHLYFLVPKIQFKALAKMKDTEVKYVFGDNSLKVFTANLEYTSESKMEYSLFVRVYETTKYIFVYKTNNQVHIIDKSTIEGGTAEDIRNKLTPYVKDKYVICKY